jgi:uncharacterized membrane protein YGL010W
VRSAADWLNEYGDSHRHPTNKALHWICVPVIVWCAIGLRAAVPIVNWGSVTVLAALLYYARLSLPLALGALPVLFAFVWSIDRLDRSAWAPLWVVCSALFVVAWIGQFIGHAVEGRRPSFVKDIQFLMIGPLWLLADVYRRLGIRY